MKRLGTICMQATPGWVLTRLAPEVLKDLAAENGMTPEELRANVRRMARDGFEVLPCSHESSNRPPGRCQG